MSFFNSLLQNVSNSVANLNLSPKRFSLSKESGGEGPGIPIIEEPPGCAVSAQQRGSTGSVGGGTGSAFPKPLPSPSGAAATSIGVPAACGGQMLASPRRAKTLDGPKRVGSFRQMSTVQRQPLMFCRRRLSWPEIDPQATSGVQETDGSFFESYAALSWKLENRRLMAIHEVAEDETPPSEVSVGIKLPPPFRITPKEMESLYVEVLYTITNKVGASSGQFSHYQDELYSYAQKAFNVPDDQHRKYLSIADEEKPPIIVLNVIIIEAEGLEAKDPNGFSDPYCMLGIQPPNTSSPQASSPGSPNIPASSGGHRQGPSSRALSEGGLDPEDSKREHHEKLRKHHSFRLSFKRKDRRETHRDSISSAVPAKFIRATSVRPQTLNPRWNEKFRFDIDDVTSDILHLDIWDHDDESSVFDAVSKLNEVRGVKGLGRFFKQIAQSARSGSQDDFLGCVNIPLVDIPSTGLDCWYKLEARTTRSNIQGRIRLKLWLSTREDRGTSEEDNWSDIRQQERLYSIFIKHEMAKSTTFPWTGELPYVALSILHQHAIQGDITDLQSATIRWLAFSKVPAIDPKILCKILATLENLWSHETLSREEEDWLADSFNIFLDYSLQLVKKHRRLFPPHHRPSMQRLEQLLRSLGMLSTMKAYWKCCPFNKEIRGEVIASLKKGTLELYEENHKQIAGLRGDPDLRIKGLVKLTTSIIVDLQTGFNYYNAVFESANGVPYFCAVYKQFEKMMVNDLGQEITALCHQLRSAEFGPESPNVSAGPEIGTSIFELYLSIQEFVNMSSNLADSKSMNVRAYYKWFEPAIDKWLDLSKLKAYNRVKAAMDCTRVCSGDKIVKHSTSSIDVNACFYQMKEFWKQLCWPDIIGAYNLIMKLLDGICGASTFYAQLVQQKLKDTGYYESTGPYKTTDEMCVAMNDLEFVRRHLTLLPEELNLESILDSIELKENTGRWREAAYLVIDTATCQLETEILLIISRIGVKMRTALKKAIFHLAWSPDSLPTCDALLPLQEYLDNHLLALNSALIPRNFERVLYSIWEYVLEEISLQTEGNTVEKTYNFYERLYEALDNLVDFFYADGKGLPVDLLTGDLFQAIRIRLSYFKSDTEQLIILYYHDRLHEQLNVESTEYGVLNVRAYYHHDSLCIEILNARDVIPLDPNGFSDPFVIVELIPKSLFPIVTEQQTNVQKKTLNPLFDECFEFSVTLDQCKNENAMIVFTVMDHDVLTANDFAGEAFLSLRNIPGVNQCNSENFHGLKNIELPLMHQKNKNHPILQTLESRQWDKMAQDFVKKQKPRLAST
uniref:BAI1-associated protein 3 n=1 Tax=Cacopsylla melanoneura TaxID=428564 RepID=A0A8D8TBQ9_9HEMI